MSRLLRYMHRMSFKRLLCVVCALTSVVFLLFINLNILLAKHQSSSNSAFAKLPRHRAHYIANSTKKYQIVNMKEPDEIKIRLKVNVDSIESVECFPFLNLPPAPKTLQETFEWQVVETGSTSGYVFSAYYESRVDPPAIRIIGITTEDFSRAFCQVWYSNKTMPLIVELQLVKLPESHGRRYSAVFYLCYLQQQVQVPYAVSVVKDPCQQPRNVMKLMNTKFDSPYVNFTVCITPLNFNYDNYHQFVEIVEVNQIFGAQHFVFYNYTTGIHVEKYLKSYEADGVVSIIPWKIPVVVDIWPPDPEVIPEIHYFGQVAALNDCLYRNMLRSRFIVFTDLDEVIVPHAHDSWSDMLMDATAAWQKTFFSLNGRRMFPGAYLVRSTIFHLDWEDVLSKQEEAQALKLLTLRKLTRERMIYPWYERSKYILLSKMATVVAVHNVFEFIDDWKVLGIKVKKEHALVHHYRLWDGKGNNFSFTGMLDDRMQHFSKEIISRVTLRYQKMEIV